MFEPDFVKIAPGDTVTFVSTDKGHNAETIKAMIPESAQGFKSELGKNFSVTLTQNGVYGIRCTPHYGMGMVAMIVVGTPDSPGGGPGRETSGQGQEGVCRHVHAAAWPQSSRSATMPARRLQPAIRPAILSYGFRPFFLAGALFVSLSVLVWLPLYYGELTLRTAFAAVDWHIHELLFGYLPAVMTGFLLTAIPNWTGRLPLQGKPLLVLVALWAAGRLAVAFSADIGWLPAALIDCSFLATLALAAGREIVAGSNWRNLKVLAAVGVLLVANIAFHLEAHYAGLSDVSRRWGIAGAIFLIMMIGGRIIPSFTRNWLAQEGSARLPAPFDRFDVSSIAAAATALILWVIMPGAAITGVVMASASLMQMARLVRWAGLRTLSNPIVFVLHAGYAFVPAGFALLAMSVLWTGFPAAAGIHALGAGAIGTMTLAVMVRATLGHTGQPVVAGFSGSTIFCAVAASALLRIAGCLRFIGSGRRAPACKRFSVGSRICWFCRAIRTLADSAPSRVTPTNGATMT